METKIKETFSGWQGVGPAGAPLNRGTVRAGGKPLIGTFSDPATPVQVVISRAQPYVQAPNSKAAVRDQLLDVLAGLIVNRRLTKLATSENAPIVGGSMSIGPQLYAIEQASMTLRGKEGEWESTLATGEQELRRALQYGFTEGELKEQMANLETSFADAAQQQDSRRNSRVADEIIRSVYDGSVVVKPAQQLELFKGIKPTLTVDAVNGALRKAWGQGPNGVFVATKKEIENPEQAVMAAVAKSSQVAVTPPSDAEAKAFAYDDFGTPGKVVSDKKVEDLGIREVRFANNVMLNVKKTDFEAGKILYSVRVGDGKLALPKDKPGLDFFMSNMFNVGGLEAHEFNELQQILAGRSVSGGLAVNDDAFVTQGSTTPQDIELQLKLTAATVTAPGYRGAADTLWQNAVPGFAGTLDATPQAVSGTQLPTILAGGDKRFGVPPVSDLLARNMAEVKAAVSEQLKNGPVEIALVGDIDEQTAIDLVAKTFGALPQRAASSPAYIAERAVSFAPNSKDIRLYHKGAEDQAMVFTYWPTTDNKNYKSVVERRMLAEVMGSLLLEEVREKLGATYSPGAGSTASSVYTGYGYIQTQIVVDPDKIDLVFTTVRDIAKSLRETEVSEDVLLRARKPLLENFQQQERENGAWLGLISDAQTNPYWLDRRRQRKAAYEAITVADIKAAARKYLTDDALVKARIVHESMKN